MKTFFSNTSFLLIAIFIMSIMQCMGCNKWENNNPEDNQSDTNTVILPVHKFYLPAELEETSGLLYSDGDLYSHNDSDGAAVLYRFDTISGQIKQVISVSNASNVDWEALAMDNNYIYIGDFGNNSGNRKDLKIYRIQRSQIPATGDGSVEAEIIQFSFSDQTDFSSALINNNFDCEAFIVKGDYLYLFSKNWINQKTRLYKLSKSPGTHSAQYIADFDVECLITGADLSSDGSLALIGYVRDQWIPVLWLFKDYPADQFFSGKRAKLALLTMVSSQTEGISFYKPNHVFISGEKTQLSRQRLFRLNLENLKVE